MTVGDTPPAEVAIDAALVQALLADQHPDLAGLELVELATGWDNVNYRLGEVYTVRLPRRSMSAVLVEHEQRWLPVLAPRLPLPIPAPVRVGRPALGYPWSWSLCPWLPGVPAATAVFADPIDAAQQVGAFLAALHTPAPADAPDNPYRGGPLTERSSHMHARIDQLADLVDGVTVRKMWDAAVGAPAWNREPVWLHGDVHPANVLVERGRVAAILDFGDITGGDPASDLAAAWMLFPSGARPAFRAAVGDHDDDTWTRARGWALFLAIAIIANSADNPTMARIGRDTLDRVLEEA
jgi:aminoglycoside phosphotransferase (APT) family kinase protein